MDILANGYTYLATNKLQSLYFDLDNGHQYVTDVRHDIAMVVASNDDVPQLLTKICGCCGSTWLCLHRASQAEIDVWNSPND